MLLAFRLPDLSYCHRPIVILLWLHHRAAINSDNSTYGSLRQCFEGKMPSGLARGGAPASAPARAAHPPTLGSAVPEFCPVCLSVSIYIISLLSSKLTISPKLLNSQEPKTQTVEFTKYTFFLGRKSLNPPFHGMLLVMCTVPNALRCPRRDSSPQTTNITP